MAEQEPRYADQAHRYRLDEPIATGGMGHVWRGTDTVLDRPVAVKLLKHEYAEDPVFRSRFATEAQHAAGLHHPGVAQVFDFGTQGAGGTDAPFLVMEYVDGKPLSSLLRPGVPMDVAATADLLAAAADAIGAAHEQGIVHRDVKPANLLVTDDRRVKITDFGIARAADSVALTRTGEVMGTPQYLSPEQAEGRTATPASDVYSLGVVGFECLAGRRPYVADSAVATALAHLRDPVPELPDEVPQALAGVVRRAMAKDPDERYPDGAAFAAAVREASSLHDSAGPAPTKVFTAPVPLATPPAADVPVVATLADSADVWRERARRVPVPVWAVGAVFVVVVVVAAIANAEGSGSGPGTTPGSGPTSSEPTSATTSATATPPTTSTTKPPPPGPKPSPKPPRHDHGHKAKGHHQ
jgi:serine/threonine protein kinase